MTQIELNEHYTEIETLYALLYSDRFSGNAHTHFKIAISAIKERIDQSENKK